MKVKYKIKCHIAKKVLDDDFGPSMISRPKSFITTNRGIPSSIIRSLLDQYL